MTYDDLCPDDQALFDATVRKLLREGLIWRELEDDRRAYNFLARRQDLIADHLQTGGWSLLHHDSLQAFQLLDAKGAHRRQLSRETAIWLIILRLLYLESRSSVVAIRDIVKRGAQFSETLSGLAEALPVIYGLKLIRPADNLTLRPGNPESLVELLPSLELVVPADSIVQTHKKLSPSSRKSRKRT